jgi:hypothetical protein
MVSQSTSNRTKCWRTLAPSPPPPRCTSSHLLQNEPKPYLPTLTPHHVPTHTLTTHRCAVRRVIAGAAGAGAAPVVAVRTTGRAFSISPTPQVKVTTREPLDYGELGFNYVQTSSVSSGMRVRVVVRVIERGNGVTDACPSILINGSFLTTPLTSPCSMSSTRIKRGSGIRAR